MADSDLRVLNLDSIDVDNLASTAESVGTAFGNTDILDLAFLLRFLQYFHCLLNGSLAVKAMNVIEINIRQPKALKRLLQSFASVLWTAVDCTIATW